MSCGCGYGYGGSGSAYEVGLTFEEALGKVGGAAGNTLLAPAVQGALADPQVQAQIRGLLAQSLEDPQIKTAVRGYVVEAAVWVGVGVTGGILLARLLTRR